MNLSHLFDFDKNFYQKHGNLAGLDEAGRGALAGPVFVGCVSIDLARMDGTEMKQVNEIKDSKQLTGKVRKKLFDYLTHSNKISIGIGQSSSEEIDKVGINRATGLAAERALDSLGRAVDLVLLDKGIKIQRAGEYREITKGDDKSLHIASASILAKVGRDRYMRFQAENYSGYGWETNVGYGTSAHREAIARIGRSDIHRKSYKLA